MSATTRPEPPVDQAVRTWAVDPRHHVVLEASAGTGKTRVLVDRYLALLEAGVDPSNILAITFTRKAAAEMRERILTDLGVRHPARWQELRDRAQDIAVSTIDAFCFALLREFPLEAGLDPGFCMADETEVARLVEMAVDAALRESRRRSAADESMRLVFAQLSAPRLAQGLRALLERRYVAPAALRAYLRGRVPGARREADIARAARDTLRRSLAAIPGGVAALLDTGPVGIPAFALFRSDVERLVGDEPMTPAEVRAAMDGVAGWVLTRDGKVRRRAPSRKADHASPAAFAAHAAAVVHAGEAVRAALKEFDTRLNVLLARGIYRIFRITLRKYRETLLLHDALDFSEVLARAVALLARMDEFSRSRFRLEARYQHVLVDEFQDTSRLQWSLVAELIRSWGEGEGLGGASLLPPSIFLVGDRKQSIYRFRDADVGLLDEATAFISSLGRQQDVRGAIAQSFRSVPGLLAFTNDVAAAMVDPSAPANVAFRYAATDRFPVQPPDDEAPTPLGVVVGEDPEACARGVALEISRLLESGTTADRDGGGVRRLRPGDIAILFRSRESHREFEQALADRGIPSYVYKGLGFYDSDEIKDLVALVRYLAVPESDLRAAALLRSRFVGLSDEGLRRLAPRIADALRLPDADLSCLDPRDAEALRRWRAALPAWRADAAVRPPADVIDRIIDESAFAFEWRGARAQQARENVKKFRALLRRIQNRGYATLTRLAAHIDRLSAGDESNAALDALDAVNLMTIHASKGLEFPVVFVVNLTRATGGLPPALRVVVQEEHQPLVAVSTYDPDTAGVEATLDREETKRLVYVAFTRARERLYLSTTAAGDRRQSMRGSLGEVLPSSLVDVLTRPADGSGVRRWQGGTTTHRFDECPVPPASDATARAASVVEVTTSMPASLAPVAHVPSARRAVTTEALGGAAASVEASDPRADDLVVGRLVHRLLAVSRRGRGSAGLEATVRALAGPDDIELLDDEAIASVIRLHAAVLEDPQLRAWLSRPDTRFEVPVTLRLPDAEGAHALVRGTIDALVTLDDAIVVIEFKTGARRAWHERQLALYVDAVSALWPGRRVEGRLVYARARQAPASGERPHTRRTPGPPAQVPRLPFD